MRSSQNERPGQAYPLGATWDGGGRDFNAYDLKGRSLVLLKLQASQPATIGARAGQAGAYYSGSNGPLLANTAEGPSV